MASKYCLDYVGINERQSIGLGNLKCQSGALQFNPWLLVSWWQVTTLFLVHY